STGGSSSRKGGFHGPASPAATTARPTRSTTTAPRETRPGSSGAGGPGAAGPPPRGAVSDPGARLTAPSSWALSGEGNRARTSHPLAGAPGWKYARMTTSVRIIRADDPEHLTLERDGW